MFNGTNKNNITKTASADYVRGTIVKLATDNKVSACSATDANAIGVLLDDVSEGDNVAVALLGVSNQTVPMIASEAISEGDKVYLAADGEISAAPAAKSTAQTVYCVGVALSPAYTDGNEIEVKHSSAIIETIAAS